MRDDYGLLIDSAGCHAAIFGTLAFAGYREPVVPPGPRRASAP